MDEPPPKERLALADQLRGAAVGSLGDGVSQMQEKVRQLGATCVFAEPQFEPKLISVITEGTAAKSATLDPEAATLEPGPDLYFKLMRGIAGSLKDCLAQP